MAISAQTKAAINTLKQSEADGVPALVATIEAELEGLDAKNFTVIGEKRTETSRKQALEEALKSIGKALNFEGDIDALLAQAESKARTLSAERDAAIAAKGELETKASEAATKLTALETSAKRNDIAKAAAVDPVIFADLFGAEDLDKFKVSDDGVFYGDKPLKEHVQGDERLKRYESALFSKVDPPKAPGAPPATKDKEPVNPALSYIQKAYQ